MTTYDKTIEWLKNQKIVAWGLVIVVVVIGIREFVESYDKLYERFFSDGDTALLDTLVHQPAAPIRSDNSNNINNIPNGKKQKGDIEISMQLEENSEGYKKIFLNKVEVKALPNSTTYNPRILVHLQNKLDQEIMIVTLSGDTCYLNSIFDQENPKTLSHRYVPKCAH